MKLPFVALICLGLSGGLTHAQTAIPDTSDIVQLELVAGWRLDSGAHMAALRISLAPGWKTYWRTGGETGIPPKLDWQGTSNLDHVVYHWPRPDIIEADGVQVIGYHNELLLPIELFPATEGASVNARVNVQIGVCNDVCIPVSTDLRATFSPDADSGRFLIELALSDTTISAAKAGVKNLGCSLMPVEDGYRLKALFDMPERARTPPQIVVFETPLPDVWVAPSQSRQTGARLSAETSLMSYGADSPTIDPSQIRITIINASQAIDAGTCVRDLQN